MYFIILLIYAFIISMTCFSMGMGQMFNYVDLLSLIVMLLLIIPMFIASGMSKEFSKAIRFMFNSKIEYERDDYRKMLEAVNLLIKLNICAGLFTMTAGLISILGIANLATLGPSVMVAIISIFYMLIICLILYPIQSKIKSKLIEV